MKFTTIDIQGCNIVPVLLSTYGKWLPSVTMQVFTSRPRTAGWFLRLLCRFRVCISVDLCVHTYHVCNNYVTHIVAMRSLVDFGNLDGCFA